MLQFYLLCSDYARFQHYAQMKPIMPKEYAAYFTQAYPQPHHQSCWLSQERKKKSGIALSFKFLV